MHASPTCPDPKIHTVVHTDPGAPTLSLRTWRYASGALIVSLSSAYKPRNEHAVRVQPRSVPLRSDLDLRGCRHLGTYRITADPGRDVPEDQDAPGPALQVSLYLEGESGTLWEQTPEGYDVLSLLVLPHSEIVHSEQVPLLSTGDTVCYPSGPLLYKATGPDGMHPSLLSEPVDLAGALQQGELVVHPESRRIITEEPGSWRSLSSSYRAYHQPGEAALLHTWPWRLFEIEAHGPVLPLEGRVDSALLSYRVRAERPAWEAFGPHGEAVWEMLGEIHRLTRAQADVMEHTRHALNAQGDQAWLTAQGLPWRLRIPGREQARQAAGLAVARAVEQAGVQKAQRSAETAVLATLMRDQLSAETYALLMRPWTAGRTSAQATRSPAGPTRPGSHP